MRLCRRGPSAGRGPGDEDEKLVRALEGIIAGKSAPEIAIDMYGADEVEASWDSRRLAALEDRRRIPKARAMMRGDYLKLVARP